jgi:hypothetical protein
VNIDTTTTKSLVPVQGYDIVLIQHEWGLFPSEMALRDYCAGSPVPVVLFAHSGGVENLAVAGVIAMHEGILRWVSGRSIVIPHPASNPPILTDRVQLRERFSLGRERLIVGSSGFLTGFRKFPEMVARLFPLIHHCGGMVQLIATRVGAPWLAETEQIEADLQKLQAAHGDFFRYEGRFLSSEELNLKLQACDVLWCFTNRASSAYASGVAADQYASGTNMVLSCVEQHRHVLNKPGVIAAPADFDGFAKTLMSAIKRQQFPRHAPSGYSWREAAHDIARFLREFASPT